MPAPTNTTTTLVSVGDREDLEDVIYRVAPEETPFISNVGSSKATGTYHEWQTETLATPSATNANFEGDDVATLDNPNLTMRVGNYCQILRKTGGVSRTQELVDKAGRTSEMNRQKTLKGIEAKRDLEMRAIGNFASNSESGGNPRRLGGMLAWLVSNASRGASGANGGFAGGTVAAATNGTQRAFTEALLKTVHQSAFTAGGKPSMLFMHPVQKTVFSGFAGIAVNRINQSSATKDQVTIIGGADTYVGDFGNLTAVVSIFMRNRVAILVDPKMAKMASLRPMKNWELAKTGDSLKRQILQEYTLEVSNEAAHGIVADLT